ncbi:MULTISPECIES: hypothetical protein [Bacillus]|uniref:Uncharacterized protein n=2 Tax=Bacillus TaxID=1386 RepID=A0A0M4FR68_9BACI|nr:MULTISPECIES: hypothetical protein [Bacillus]ALC80193.1 hypothetical protein AM592_00195 [Bacillus gobiensis]MBP1082829.1 hypothetical protein [Bacillus capparidis]MED1098470.1 hypothetical protein [Bacillus capparidis]
MLAFYLEHQKDISGQVWSKTQSLTVHKQGWHGEGTAVYDPNNDLSLVSNMLKTIPVEDQVKCWNEEKNAVLYKGIRDWGNNLEGIRCIGEKGEINVPSIVDTRIIGPTISLYIPGKENMITPERYVLKQ